jgi:DNA-binding transcriptional LysR family regulator
MIEIDLRLLRSAVIVATELNITRASDLVGVSQPALTKQLQELESRLGVRLFDRDTQNVELTDAGRAFIPKAELSLFYRGQAIDAARLAAKGAEAVLHVGQSPYLDPFVSSVLGSTHLPMHPTLRVQITSDISPNLIHKVSRGELDLAVVTAAGDSKQLSSVELANAPMYLLMDETSELARYEGLTLDQLKDVPWILFTQQVHPYLYNLISDRAQALGVSPREKHHVTTAEQAAQLVHSTGGVAFLWRAGAWRVAVDHLTIRSLAESGIRVRTVITSHIEASRLVGEFMRAVVRKVQNSAPAYQAKRSRHA